MDRHKLVLTGSLQERRGFKAFSVSLDVKNKLLEEEKIPDQRGSTFALVYEELNHDKLLQ